ncbi:MAG: NAD-dependent epimerase/dehydratase family protein [Streptosporangiaceae bacterium]
MRVLILGASGFLGTHVLDRAQAAGLNVVTAGRRDIPGSPDHRLLDLTRADRSALGALLADTAPAAVLNCAGLTAGSPADLAAVNLTGSCLLAAAVLADRRGPRLVQLGSAAEYGRSEPGSVVTESWPERPVSAYGTTKLAASRAIQLARLTGLDAVVLRVFNPVGRGAPESGLPGRLGAELRRSAGGRGEIRLGPLDVVRDFIDADDVADAVLAAAAAASLPHPVLNIGSGRGTPVRELVGELIAISGYRGQVREDGTGSARSAAMPWQQAGIELARLDLGWQPRRSLARSVADLWAGTGSGREGRRHATEAAR